MNHLHSIIKEEVSKLFKAILEGMDGPDDDCILVGYITRCMDLITLYEGGFTVDGFLDNVLIPEEREYYSNILKDEEYEYTELEYESSSNGY
jgi:hypothetical protein